MCLGMLGAGEKKCGDSDGELEVSRERKVEEDCEEWTGLISEASLIVCVCVCALKIGS